MPLNRLGDGPHAHTPEKFLRSYEATKRLISIMRENDKNTCEGRGEYRGWYSPETVATAYGENIAALGHIGRGVISLMIHGSGPNDEENIDAIMAAWRSMLAFQRD